MPDKITNKQNLSWDEYFMGLAIFTSFRSKDPSSKVGAVIVDENNHIVGTGYNGFVAGIDESKFSWDREGDFLSTKYPYVVHAEANAILNSTKTDLSKCRVYVTLATCNECAKLLAQKGIKKIYYLLDKYPEVETFLAARRIFDIKKIEYKQFEMDNLYGILDKFKNYYPENIK